MAWLSGWNKRVKLTIDQNDIDAALSNFPILVYLSASSGRTSADVSCVFDELTSDDNRKKIAVTTSDGDTECYVEIEKWDDANEQAWLWVKVPSIASDADTDLYLYYDSSHADNDSYVGDPNSTPAETVWGANFKLVWHLRDDPDTSHVKDSTSNHNDGTKVEVNGPTEIDGKIGRAQSFDYSNDYIASGIIEPDAFTVSALVYLDSKDSADSRLLASYDANTPYLLWYDTDNDCWAARIRDDNGNQWQPDNNDLTVEIQTWTLLALTYNNPTGIFYKNDGVIVSDSVTLSAVAEKTGANFNLGRITYAPYLWRGDVDEVRISDIARPAAWLKATYETGRDDLLTFGSEESALSWQPIILMR